KFNTPRINSTSSVLRLCAASPLETRCLLPITLAPGIDRHIDIAFCLFHQGGELGAIHLAKVGTVDRDIIHLPAGVAGFAQAVLHQVNLAGTAVDFLVDHGAVIGRFAAGGYRHTDTLTVERQHRVGVRHDQGAFDLVTKAAHALV